MGLISLHQLLLPSGADTCTHTNFVDNSSFKKPSVLDLKQLNPLMAQYSDELKWLTIIDA